WSYFDLVTIEKIGVLDTYSDDNELTPATVKLLQNYPNPFNSVTKISYQLSEPTFINLAVFDVNGRRVETLVNANNNAGFHSIEWKANDMSSGLYFYRLKTSNYTEVKKCLILK
ncbi:MAG: T9SS type A sorting domain-containing protein, partial [Fidelibacterota bacterium]